jgi:molybdate transport system substrate-binding protein
MLKPLLGLTLKLRKFVIPLLAISMTMAVDAYAREKILLFGAISTTNAITAIAKDFAERDICSLSPVFAASSTLARQIAVGAPADIFLSANQNWMDWLDEKAKLELGSRVDMLGNRLVMIVPADSKENLELTESLIAKLGDSRFVIADPDHVPAGIYAKAALESLGLWQTLSPRLARMQNVRTALAVIERRGADAGIVYTSDAAASKRVRVASVIDANLHPTIRYPIAIIVGRATSAVLACYEHLLSATSAAIFESHGFSAR